MSGKSTLAVFDKMKRKRRVFKIQNDTIALDKVLCEILLLDEQQFIQHDRFEELGLDLEALRLPLMSVVFDALGVPDTDENTDCFFKMRQDNPMGNEKAAQKFIDDVRAQNWNPLGVTMPKPERL